jgi:Rrf2 family protein
MELARQYGKGAVPISEIAKVYGISQRFMEVILNELKRAGLVGSKRGVQGGFFLAVQPREVTVGDIIRFVDGPLEPVKCVVGRAHRPCPQKSGCPLPDIWGQASRAVGQVYDSANFEYLIRRENLASAPDYHI